MTISRFASFAVAAAFVAACRGGTEPPVPASVVAMSANPLSSTVVGSAIAAAPTFEVRSSAGKPLAGIPVSVVVSSGGGQLTGVPSVSLAGPTPIGQWTLGTTSGPQSVSVTVSKLTPLVFTVASVAGAVAEFAIAEGNNQYATQLTPVANPLRVRVRDAFANPVVGASVAWAVAGGGGSLAAGAVTLSGVDGIATAPAWTLGGVNGGQQAVVAVLGSDTLRFTAIAQLPPASLSVVDAAPASATVFTSLPVAPSFVVRDSTGTALAGIPVSVAITAGNGQLGSAPTVTVAGPTAIGNWRLGTTAGMQAVTVVVSGLAPQVFTVNATPDVPALVTAVQGGGQTALAGTTLPITPQAKVTDQFGNALAGQVVQWTVSAGGGSLTGNTAPQTDGSGIAAGPAWTLGKNGGAQALVAASSGLTQVFTAFIQSDYRIDLRFVGTAPTGAVALAFQDAAARISAMIVGDVQDVQINNVNLIQCDSAMSGQPAINELIDDIVIYARVAAIDGVGRTLGAAGPCMIRNSGGLTALGTMKFDSADLESLAIQGRLSDVILHEMLHVIGIGTLWESRQLLTGKGTSGVAFTGILATTSCANDAGGSAVCVGSVPVENCLDLTVACGAGTINSHWKESIFKSELMTGYSSASSPLARFSIQSLADMGYAVNLLSADAYTVPPPALMAGALLDGSTPLPLPPPSRPKFTVDHAGRVRPIPQ